MALITLEQAKSYLRVDSADEDALIRVLLSTAYTLSKDVARLSEDQRIVMENGDDRHGLFATGELAKAQELMRTATLYALGYLYEHREEADHLALTLTLRSLLFSLREGVF